jgi:RND family efflux transporter MFP subunit
VKLGDRVKEGKVLFVVDPSDVESQQAQAKIQRDAAGKGRSAAASGVSTARSAVSDAKKAVKDAKSDLKDAKNALKKAKKLPQVNTPSMPATSPAVSPAASPATSAAASPVAAAEQLVAQAEAVLAQAKAAQKQAEAGLTQAQSGYDQADAQYRLANEGVSAADNAISETTVRAPIAGYITGITVQRGGMVSQAMPSVVITGTGKIQVATTVAENLVSGIHAGDAVDVYVRAVSDEPFAGTISRIVPAPPTGQTTYPVVIDFDYPGKELRPGMFAEISMATDSAEGVILVPSDSVTIRNGKEVIAVLDADNKVHITEVESGIDDGTDVEILSGISAGDRVVTEGQHYIDDSSNVKVVD